jgi:hypothetical protein
MKELALYLFYFSLLILANCGFIGLGLNLISKPDNLMAACGVFVLWGLGFGNCLLLAKAIGVK